MSNPSSAASPYARRQLRPSHFRLPAALGTPVIFVAGGVGIAPFRAFVLERLAHVLAGGPPLGPSMLLYGVRSEVDVLYRGLLDDAVAAGALGMFDVGVGDPAGASGGAGKEAAIRGPRFIGDLVAAHAEELWSALQVRGESHAPLLPLSCTPGTLAPVSAPPQAGGVVYICGGSTGFGEAVAAVGARARAPSCSVPSRPSRVPRLRLAPPAGLQAPRV